MAPSRIYYEDLDGTNSEEAIKLKKASIKGFSDGLGPAPGVDTPQAWNGSDLVDADYIVSLSESEEAEVSEAARGIIVDGVTLGTISPVTFPLPTLGPRLLEVKQRLQNGLGFFVLRGLRPDNYDEQTNIVVFLGISSYIGNKRAIQYKGGPVLAHVVDLSGKEDAEKHRGEWMGAGNRNTVIPFHTDLGHTLCLYSRYSNPSGGRSRLASSKAIVDVLKSERPDIVGLLKMDWQWDTLADEVSWVERPLLSEVSGKVLLGYSRRPLLGCPDFPRRSALKPLTEQQVEALQVLEDVADRVALNFEFKTGDVQYINNLVTLHAREGYERYDTPGFRRHLLRISIKDEEAEQTLPRKLEDILGPMYDHELKDELFPWHTGPLPYSLPP